jgi:hypothetical protein
MDTLDAFLKPFVEAESERHAEVPQKDQPNIGY